MWSRSNGVMNQLTQTGAWPGNVKYVRNLLPTSLYAQDQWTSGKLTLQGGVRYDYVLTTYPESSVGGPARLPHVPPSARSRTPSG